MTQDTIDVAVIGGGVHGAGVAQAVAAAGYSVTLLEKTSIAAGTSSKSSKLIHGGLRYLENLDIRLVRESLREREILIKNAPALVTRQPFFIPLYTETSRRPWFVRTGLTLYSLLTGFSKYTEFRSIPTSDWNQLDGLKTAGLQKVFRYWDAQTDDRLLTQAVMNSAIELGARLLCPAEFLAAHRTPHGYRIHFRENDHSQTLDANFIVNAAGPWARLVAENCSPSLPVIPVDNIQGTHIELPGPLQQGCYYLEVPEDHRAVFAIPWQGHTLFGTTEHRFTGKPEAVTPLQTEIDYLLKIFKYYFPQRDTEVLHAWSGLRVLPAADSASFKSSRETQLIPDSETHAAAISIFGGKLTAYRATAEKVVDMIRKTLPEKSVKADTRILQLQRP